MSPNKDELYNTTHLNSDLFVDFSDLFLSQCVDCFSQFLYGYLKKITLSWAGNSVNAWKINDKVNVIRQKMLHVIFKYAQAAENLLIK